MKYLILIPARGGSKGLPGKNTALVGGVPLLGRAVRTALQAVARGKLDARVVCSTDDTVCGSTARVWGATVLRRPDELATDTASLVDVALHALAEYPAEHLIMLQPTSPLRSVDDICGAVAQYEKQDIPLVSVCDCEHPPEWARMFDALGNARKNNLGAPSRRQDAMPSVRVNGAIYIISSAVLNMSRQFVTPDAKAYRMSITRSLDIDDARDLYMADMIIRRVVPTPVKIAECMVGPDNPVFVVAEAGCNHQGDPELGFRLIDAAKEAGCDCVKFQAFRAELTVPPEGLDAIRPLEFDMRSIVMMKHYTEKNNMVFLCTPFDTWSVDMLADIGSYAYKISSGDVTNIPLLQRIAAKKLPVILSTGMANMVEIEYALRALEGVPVVLTQCTSLYPAEPWQANLRAMESMQAAFGVPVGLSDHTLGTAVPLAAVAMGACVIEKHITLDRGMAGPDHAMSMATSELTNFVDAIRAVESARGTGYKAPCDDEAHAKLYYRRGIYAWCDIAAGELFTDGNVFARRPEAEMKPDKLPGLYGKAASRAYKTGDAICE